GPLRVGGETVERGLQRVAHPAQRLLELAVLPVVLLAQRDHLFAEAVNRRGPQRVIGAGGRGLRGAPGRGGNAGRRPGRPVAAGWGWGSSSSQGSSGCATCCSSRRAAAGISSGRSGTAIVARTASTSGTSTAGVWARKSGSLSSGSQPGRGRGPT